MAFVVPGKSGRFEIRESTSTPKGPRSRTLVSFREFDDAVVETARERATKAIDATELRQAAKRAGASVARKPVDRAARELIAELGKGRRLDPPLRQMLLDILRESEGSRREGARLSSSDSAPSISAWMAATPEERGKALVDLLLLVDALPPSGRKKEPLRFPRLDSRVR
jgi:hypothetical protein